jgi:flagellar hook-associated protein 1 FlgK
MSFFGINLASRSLQADQQALEVTGQNITNANVPGYSRQVAIIRSVTGPGASGLDQAGNPLAPGGGIDVAMVQRAHAAWLDQQSGQLQAQAGQTGIDSQTAQSVEGLLAEPTDAGLSATMDRFLAAFGNLATHAGDSASRDQVLQAGQALADKFSQLDQGLQSQQQGVIAAAKENVNTINDLAKQVAALSHDIGAAQAAGANPNEALDQRDQLLAQLVQRTGATVSGQQGAEVVVSLAGAALVQGDHANSLDLAPGASLSVTLHGSGAPVTVAGGELHAEQAWANTTLPEYRTRLDNIRDGFAAAVNSLHQSGRDASGSPGQPFFTASATGAISVNPALLSDSSKVVSGDGTAGSGSVALSISNLGTAAGSVIPQYRQLVADIGRNSADSSQASDQAQAGLQQIQTAQASESGVNLDEELAQMVSQQQSYAASARLLSTFDQLLSTLIQQTGGTA